MQRAVSRNRIETIDLARGIALVAMAIYHFTWDLEFFGYAEPGLTAAGGWKYFARSIAASFLVLVGISLYLAHRNEIRWASFGKRLAMVAGAALAISIVTYVAVPDGFIFFGILHQIAFASVAGLAFLRLPWWSILIAAVAVVAAPYLLRSAVFDPPWLWWVGLSSSDPRSNDYVPVFPWFGATLAGIAAAKLMHSAGTFDRLADLRYGRWSQPLKFAGRHSLAFYLIHQPVLIAAIWVFAQIFPAPAMAPEAGFLSACELQCSETRAEDFCMRYCDCVLDTLEADDRLGDVLAGAPSEENSAYLREIAGVCTADTERAMTEEVPQ